MPNADAPPEPAAGSRSAITAFAALYEAHLPAIVRYLRRRLGDAAADDAASEVFVRAFRARGAAEGPAALDLPWLYGIAANVIHEERRAERRRLRLIERVASQSPREAAAGPGSEATLDPKLARGLRRLSPPDRETLLLVAWGELSYDETARALGVPVGTVASRISRARRQLDESASAADRRALARSVQGDSNA